MLESVFQGPFEKYVHMHSIEIYASSICDIKLDKSELVCTLIQSYLTLYWFWQHVWDLPFNQRWAKQYHFCAQLWATLYASIKSWKCIPKSNRKNNRWVVYLKNVGIDQGREEIR